ncbi:MAG TPA: hypothetical protein DEB17_10370 [Chlorobaculum sp.]|uniref:Uncharacterized protein n=1 Tax=Chlorobaculum tepidum (strain ATCC 49652 / DSM 12025 / NBRC 103806 / TLS) TaxID=194439 RepID=Q8KG53_CHLTE|nr:hypothetical protein CT0115 [Chlorobaculum tepidum TLS]HBU24373.1 hypothetical protein [Chlorobaculum sp.]
MGFAKSTGDDVNNASLRLKRLRKARPPHYLSDHNGYSQLFCKRRAVLSFFMIPLESKFF